MSEKKSDQIKIYIVLGLALVMVILGYFRFIHKKADPNETEGHPPVASSDAGLNITERIAKNLQNNYWYKKTTDKPLGILKRDIFVNLNSLNEAENRSGGNSTSNPASTLKLRGTIVGGKNPIAIINDQFVRIGDWIDEYKLVMIGKREVLLASGNKKIKVEMLESGKK